MKSVAFTTFELLARNAQKLRGHVILTTLRYEIFSRVPSRQFLGHVCQMLSPCSFSRSRATSIQRTKIKGITWPCPHPLPYFYTLN